MDQADIAKQQKLEKVLLIEISAIPSSKIWNVAVLDELKTIKLFKNKKYMPLCCKTTKYMHKKVFVYHNKETEVQCNIYDYRATKSIIFKTTLQSSQNYHR